MARGVNNVILVGNLGNDPDVKYTQGGMAVTRFSLATTSVRKDRDGNAQERTEWHKVVAFGKLGEIAGEYLAKGRQVYVEGELRYSTQETDSGTRYYTDVVANELQFLGGQGGGEGGGHGGGASRGGGRGSSSGGRGDGGGRQSSSREPAQRSAPPADDFADDDIPF